MLQIIGWMICCVGIPLLVANASGKNENGSPKPWVIAICVIGVLGLVFCFFSMNNQAEAMLKQSQQALNGLPQ